MKHGIRQSLRKSVLAVLGSALLFSSFYMPEQAAAASTTYYVDSIGGDDNNNGTDPSAPWKTITKVNAMTFGAGDQILFKSGSVFSGTLTPKGSGASSSPIVIDKYGTGAAPIIDGAGAGKAVHLLNVEYMTLRNLEIVNDAATQAERNGIVVEGQGAGRKLNGIHLENLDIHNIKGISEQVNRYKNAAILVKTTDPTATSLTSFGDLQIVNNHIHDITTSAMYFNGTSTHGSQGAAGDYSNWYTGVAIRNNMIERTGGDGIVVAYAVNPIIEHNAVFDAGINDVEKRYLSGMWSWGAKDVVWQYNEVARTRSETQALADSVAFDTDIATYGTHIYQYNYSHDNTGGFFMSMGQLKGENIVRYNISQNDGHNHNANNTISAYDRTHLYNNVFYNDKPEGMNLNNGSLVTYTNNIFSTTATIAFPAKPVYDYNNYFGSAPPAGDLHAMNVDPQFVNPGTGADGMNTVDGYKLQSTSPLIGKGRAIAGNGGKDYWGNPVYNGMPDIGAFEYQGTVPAAENAAPAAPSDLRVKERLDTELTFTWSEGSDDQTVKPGYEVYDADTNTLLAWTAWHTEAKVTKLQPLTAYRFYVKTRDAAGNLSAPSAVLEVTTGKPGLIVDNLEATVVGAWTSSGWAGNKVGPTYLVTAPNSAGDKSVTWRPNLPKSGEYYVYYSLPDGGPTRAPDAPFTVYYEGGSQTYLVNEKPGIGGNWILLGRHYFEAGTSGYVQLTSKASGEHLIADAVKFNYIESEGELKGALQGPSEVFGTQTFSTTYKLQNVTDNVYTDVYGSVYGAVYAQHITLTYNPNLLEFVDASSIKDGVALLGSNTNVPGVVELVAASTGTGITQDASILQLNWRAKPITQNQATQIVLASVVVGDGFGTEQQAEKGDYSLSIVFVNKSALLSLITQVQAAYNAAVEGLEVGQYKDGSKAVLQTAIDSAAAAANDGAANQQAVDAAVAALNAALQTFESNKYFLGDLNKDLKISVGDLSRVASFYAITSASPDWSKVKDADFDEDGEIDLEDLTRIARVIIDAN